MYDCEKCNKKFASKISLTNHMKLNHVLKLTNKRLSTSAPKSPAKKLIKVSITDGFERRIGANKLNNSRRDSENVSILARRLSSVKQLPTNKVASLIRCEICDLNFTTFTSLFKHKTTHTDIKVKCAHCSATFKSNIQLQNHLRTHVNILEISKETSKTTELLKNQSVESVPEEQLSDNEEVEKTNKSMLSMIEHIPKKKLAHGGIPLSSKLRNKLRQRKI